VTLAGPGVAILPFRASNPDLLEWREGLMDLVSANIDGAAGLRAIDSRAVLARLREFSQDPQLIDESLALAAAQRTGAQFALLGNVSSLGMDLRLHANVYELENARSLGRVTAQGSRDSLYTLIDRFSISVLQIILEDESADLPGINLTRVTTSSLPALKHFLEGQVLFRRSEFDAAIPAYHRAIEEDSTFALAFYRLGLAYGWAENVGSDLSEYYEEEAMRFADRLPEREAILVEGALALERMQLGGVEPLRLAVRKYPDETEAWYLLADTYYHMGNQILVDDNEAEQTFARAINVDPSFSPAYIHALDYAFFHADSARAAELLDRYSEIAAESKYNRRYRLVYELAWGNQTERKAALSALDSMDAGEVLSVGGRLWHPRFLPVATQLYAALQKRDNVSVRVPVLLFWANCFQGKRQAALELLNDPLLADYPRKYELYWLYDRDWPVPDGLLEGALEFIPTDTTPLEDLFYVVAYAADRGRWTDHAQALDHMRNNVERSTIEGDSIQTEAMRGAIEALEGHAMWRLGQAAEAVDVLERAHAEVRSARHGIIIRGWLATLYEELDQPKRAEEYLKTYRAHQPLVEFSLGRLYERLGEYDKSRESFELFLFAWQDADVDLRTYVAEAQQAIARTSLLSRD
jgi:tetratricopeptide (TPR) repeat protein